MLYKIDNQKVLNVYEPVSQKVLTKPIKYSNRHAVLIFSIKTLQLTVMRPPRVEQNASKSSSPTKMLDGN